MCYKYLLDLITPDSKPEMFSASDGINFDITFTYKECLDDCLKSTSDVNETTAFKIEVVLDFIYEQLNIGHWSKVPLNVRRAYTSASFIKAVILLKLDNSEESIRKVLKCVDMGLLLGAPLESNHNLLAEVASYLTKVLNKFEGSEASTSSKSALEDVDKPKPKKIKIEPIIQNYSDVKAIEIPTENCPSLQSFNEKYFAPQLPVKVQGCMTHWPASSKWLDVNYLTEKAGSRTVPVEIGSQYTDDDWSQKLMTLADFIKKYYNNSDEIGYVAQHNLFDQISDLKNDIRTPEYCCLSRDFEKSCDPDINAWFGPKGTVSPLHFDPKDNLLAQVFGSKQILLFHPHESGYLYPHEDMILFNTSRVNLSNPNLDEFPLFSKATMYKCLLNAGEMLYIPAKWWHHVTALDKSFSVSFWWQ